MILASSSPRRKELLKQIGLEVEIQPADIDETAGVNENPEKYVQRMAMEKAICIRSKLGSAVPIISGDTIVVVDGSILGKPSSESQFRNMMQQLSGRQHEVLSAFTLLCKEINETSIQRTSVWFRPLSDLDIEEYWLSGEPEGRAGGYAIQGLGALFVERIEGSYSSVMGFPIFEIGQMLSKYGLLRTQNTKAGQTSLGWTSR